LYLLNLFAYRAPTPQALKQAVSPIGPENDRYWGNDGSHLARAQAVRKMLPHLHVLKVNASGEPAHPLYLKADLRPFLWSVD